MTRIKRFYQEIRLFVITLESIKISNKLGLQERGKQLNE